MHPRDLVATSVLECEEFALLVFDTEGTDSVDASAPEVTNLLAFALHISSMLVYNSKNVPRGKDLKKIRYVVRLVMILDSAKFICTVCQTVKNYKKATRYFGCYVTKNFMFMLIVITSKLMLMGLYSLVGHVQKSPLHLNVTVIQSFPERSFFIASYCRS